MTLETAQGQQPNGQQSSNESPADDLRSALEAAIEQEEASLGTVVPASTAVPPAGTEHASGEGVPGTADGQGAPADGAGTPTGTEQSGDGTRQSGQQQQPTEKWSVDHPPQSWKAAAKGTWNALPLEARTEVIRREKQITQTLGESAQARQFANQFTETVRPFEARFRAANATPLQAVDALLKADHILMTAPTAQRAEHMARLILDYGIDFKALDEALVGLSQGRPSQQSNGVASEVDRLVAQRLAPLQQFVNQQQQQALFQQQAQQQSALETIEKMAQDDINFPHFDAVRQDMADIIEINQRRGISVDLKTAYSRAVAMNSNLGGTRMTPQQQAHARAQRALGASVSVGGSPSGVPTGGKAGSTDLRGTIEAAFASVGASR